jgi:hypothetical protein
MKDDWLQLEAEIRGKVVQLQHELVEERKEKEELVRELERVRGAAGGKEVEGVGGGGHEGLLIQFRQKEAMLKAEHLAIMQVSFPSLLSPLLLFSSSPLSPPSSSPPSPSPAHFFFLSIYVEIGRRFFRKN